MAITVVEGLDHENQPLTHVSESRGKICFASDLKPFPNAIAELQNADTRRQAMAEAGKRGLASPRCEMPTSPYPVDESGQPIVDPRNQKIAQYRIEIPVNAGLR